MRFRFVMMFGVGIACGVALRWWMEAGGAGGMTVVTAARSESGAASSGGVGSLMTGVPYVEGEADLVPSMLLRLLALDEEDGSGANRLLPRTMVSALALNDEEVAATTAYLRRVADNWTYVVRVFPNGDSRWTVSYPAHAAKATLKDIAEWAEKTLGVQRGYLFMVLMEHDLRILFLPEDVRLEKRSANTWCFISEQHGYTFELDKHAQGSPMMRLKAKCEAR
jgi:hypothetical protein